jgi:hypothetical protein
MKTNRQRRYGSTNPLKKLDVLSGSNCPSRLSRVNVMEPDSMASDSYWRPDAVAFQPPRSLSETVYQ